MKKGSLFLLFFFGLLWPLCAAEFENGRIRLVINEINGAFSLFYLADLDSDNFEALFADQREPRPKTSYLSLKINERFYKLGETTQFTVRLGGSTDEPEIIFDSPGIRVRQKFVFLSVGNSVWANGVAISVTVENKRSDPVRAGIRFLLDNFLGEEEGGAGPSFTTDIRPLASETLLTANSPDGWWISRNSRFGFMGTINSEYVLPPSSVHFANWKRLNDSSWNLEFSPRNFSSPPHSFNDAAVCWIYEPVEIAAKSLRVVELLLAAETPDGFSAVNFSVPPVRLARNSRDGSGYMPSRDENINTDLGILREIMAEIDAFSARGEAVPEEKLAEMELTVARVRERYGIF
jgi:hypothetical protein